VCERAQLSKRRSLCQRKTEGGLDKELETGLQICGAGRKSREKPMLVVGKKPNGKSRFKTMNETLLSRIGKLFFPRLAPDQRHHRMIIVLLVTLTCLFSAGILISWMMSNRGIHIVVGHSFPFSRK
jgi:hypothetical protein